MASQKDLAPKNLSSPLSFGGERVGSSGVGQCTPQNPNEGLVDQNFACVCAGDVPVDMCVARNCKRHRPVSGDVCNASSGKKICSRTVEDVIHVGRFSVFRVVSMSCV